MENLDAGLADFILARHVLWYIYGVYIHGVQETHYRKFFIGGLVRLLISIVAAHQVGLGHILRGGGVV